jgi:DNA-binding response OmpR family regulator
MYKQSLELATVGIPLRATMPLTQKRVLIVDNEDSIRAALELHLAEVGWHALTTWSGLEALGILKSIPFDVLLVDDYLPDLHIGEFLKQISRLRACPRVFVMQAKPTQRDIRFSGAAGVWPLVDKTQIPQVIEAIGPKP